MHEQSSSNSVTTQFLIETLQDFGNMPTFKRTFSQDLDLLENHLTNEIISQTDCKTTLTKLRTTKYMLGVKCSSIYRTPQLLKQKKLMQTQEDHLNPIPALNVDSLKADLVIIQNTCSEKEEILSKGDSKGTRIELGVQTEFMSLFGQDVDTFTSIMFLNIDQLQKQLDKDEFQEVESMTAFWVVNNQFQKFIDSKFTLDYDSQMTDNYFVEYTGIEVKNLLRYTTQQPGNVKKSIVERTRHQDNMKKGLNSADDKQQVSGMIQLTPTFADDADIRPIYDKEPMAEVQLTAECNIFAIGQQHTEQPEIVVDGHRFSPNKTFAMYENTSSISDLRWKPMGRSLKSVGLRWIPTGKLFDSCTSKVDSEPPHGSNVNILNIHECKQPLDVSAGTSINVQKEQSLDLSASTLCNVNKENLRVWLLKKLISQKPLSTWIHR
ncbi:hypothetical protein Tco_0266554 [Tanacetum coccineum]